MPDLEMLTAFVEQYGYIAVFTAMLLEGMCVPVPSELVMGFAGFMVFQGKLSFTGAVLAGWLGSLSGSLTIFTVARKGGRRFLYRWCHLVRLTPAHVDMIGDWFNRYGPMLIVPWRQLPVVRTKISIAAGLLDMRYLTFGFYTALGIAGWCTLSLSLGYYFGRNWQHLIAIFTEIGYYAIAAFVVVFLAAVGYLLYARRRKIKEEVR